MLGFSFSNPSIRALPRFWVAESFWYRNEISVVPPELPPLLLSPPIDPTEQPETTTTSAAAAASGRASRRERAEGTLYLLVKDGARHCCNDSRTDHAMGLTPTRQEIAM